MTMHNFVAVVQVGAAPIRDNIALLNEHENDHIVKPKSIVLLLYRSGTLNSNTVNSKFHLIRSFFEIFARFLSFHV